MFGGGGERLLDAVEVVPTSSLQNSLEGLLTRDIGFRIYVHTAASVSYSFQKLTKVQSPKANYFMDLLNI